MMDMLNKFEMPKFDEHFAGFQRKIGKYIGRRSKMEQHVAVFGESGSGKTTLLTAFYGHQQASVFSKQVGYSLLAEDATQGNKLLQAYLSIEEGTLPPQTRYEHKAFGFKLRIDKIKKDKEAARIVWHDYPGEWWGETREGEEGRRKNEAFQSLLCSNVALFLVDGQRLRDNKEHYLPLLFRRFRDELSRQRSNLMKDGNPLDTFPRVWIICLSKADLFPDKDVEWFRSEILKKACNDVGALCDEIGSMVTKPEFVTLGSDYLLLSSAKFNPETGGVTDPKKTIGIELLPPIAFISPIKYTAKWAKIEEQTKNWLDIILKFIIGTTDFLKIAPYVGGFFKLISELSKRGAKELDKVYQQAVENNDAIAAVLAALYRRLDSPDTEKIYITQSKD